MSTRKYEKKKRAEQQQETRQRIVEATVHLHETVGGKAASISAIAQQAGVERLTVYRHFPDERALLTACTGHYLAEHRPPDPAQWAGIGDAERRLHTALTDIYAYHAETEAMMNSAYRDMDDFPVLKELLQPFFDYWASVADTLIAPFAVDDARRPALRALVALAIHFLSWRALIREQGLDNAQAAALMAESIGGYARGC